MEYSIELNERVAVAANRFLLASDYERIWRVRPTYQESTQIPWLKPVEPPIYNTSLFVRDTIAELEYERNPDLKLERLALSNPLYFAWVWIPPYMYIRIKERAEPAYSAFGAMVAYEQEMYFTMPHFFSNENYSLKKATDGSYVGYRQIRPFLLSDYSTKMTADTSGVLKFGSANVELLRLGQISTGAEQFVGNPLTIYDDELNVVDMMIVRDGTDGYETTNLKAKDYRSSIADNVPRVQFDRTIYVQTARPNVIAMSTDAGKKYVQDAIGYCRGVPGVCLNDYAYDQACKDKIRNIAYDANFRYYFFCQGTFQPDQFSYVMGPVSTNSDYIPANVCKNSGIEVKNSESWFWLRTNLYTVVRMMVDVTPPLENYKQVTLVRVASNVSNPPESGSSVPNYGNKPRDMRATGWFHTELNSNQTIQEQYLNECARPFNIIQYIFQNFSSSPWNDSYFNIDNLKTQLAVLNTHPIGIFFDKPKELFKSLQQLQTGCNMGFQFIVVNGRIDCIVNNPNDPIKYTINDYDVGNLESLSCSMNAEDYVSGLTINYGKIFKAEDTDETYAYTNERVRDTITARLGIPKDKIMETLLKTEAGAKEKYKNECKCLLGICPSLSGVDLHDFNKWKGIKPYDRVYFSNPDLTNRTRWMVTGVSINWTKETITIDLRALPILDINNL